VGEETKEKIKGTDWSKQSPKIKPISKNPAPVP